MNKRKRELFYLHVRRFYKRHCTCLCICKKKTHTHTYTLVIDETDTCMLTNNKHVIVSFTGYVLMTLIFFFILINVYRLFFNTNYNVYKF